MLFPSTVWPGLASGDVTLAFRAWKRPTVKVGGTLITPAGQLAIDAVEPIDPAAITDEDARRAGSVDANEIRGKLQQGEGRQTYRVDFHLAGEDPRIALRASTDMGGPERDELRRKLEGYDRRSPTGPWTIATLRVIRERPGVVSTELAEAVGDDRPQFKLRVRKLKALGLTESLEVGYRLSPRGAAYLDGEAADPTDPTAPGG